MKAVVSYFVVLCCCSVFTHALRSVKEEAVIPAETFDSATFASSELTNRVYRSDTNVRIVKSGVNEYAVVELQNSDTLSYLLSFDYPAGTRLYYEAAFCACATCTNVTLAGALVPFEKSCENLLLPPRLTTFRLFQSTTGRETLNLVVGAPSGCMVVLRYLALALLSVNDNPYHKATTTCSSRDCEVRLDDFDPEVSSYFFKRFRPRYGNSAYRALHDVVETGQTRAVVLLPGESVASYYTVNSNYIAAAFQAASPTANYNFTIAFTTRSVAITTTFNITQASKFSNFTLSRLVSTAQSGEAFTLTFVSSVPANTTLFVDRLFFEPVETAIPPFGATTPRISLQGGQVPVADFLVGGYEPALPSATCVRSSSYRQDTCAPLKQTAQGQWCIYRMRGGTVRYSVFFAACGVYKAYLSGSSTPSMGRVELTVGNSSSLANVPSTPGITTIGTFNVTVVGSYIVTLRSDVSYGNVTIYNLLFSPNDVQQTAFLVPSRWSAKDYSPTYAYPSTYDESMRGMRDVTTEAPTRSSVALSYKEWVSFVVNASVEGWYRLTTVATSGSIFARVLSVNYTNATCATNLTNCTSNATCASNQTNCTSNCIQNTTCSVQTISNVNVTTTPRDVLSYKEFINLTLIESVYLFVGFHNVTIQSESSSLIYVDRIALYLNTGLDPPASCAMCQTIDNVAGVVRGEASLPWAFAGSPSVSFRSTSCTCYVNTSTTSAPVDVAAFVRFNSSYFSPLDFSQRSAMGVYDAKPFGWSIWSKWWWRLHPLPYLLTDAGQPALWVPYFTMYGYSQLALSYSILCESPDRDVKSLVMSALCPSDLCQFSITVNSTTLNSFAIRKGGIVNVTLLRHWKCVGNTSLKVSVTADLVVMGFHLVPSSNGPFGASAPLIRRHAILEAEEFDVNVTLPVTASNDMTYSNRFDGRVAFNSQGVVLCPNTELNYTVEVANPGLYQVRFVFSGALPPIVLVNGVPQISSLTSTGNLSFPLAGRAILTLRAPNSTVCTTVDSMEVALPTLNEDALVLPCTIEASNYDWGVFGHSYGGGSIRSRDSNGVGLLLKASEWVVYTFKSSVDGLLDVTPTLLDADSWCNVHFLLYWNDTNTSVAFPCSSLCQLASSEAVVRLPLPAGLHRLFVRNTGTQESVVKSIKFCFIPQCVSYWCDPPVLDAARLWFSEHDSAVNVTLVKANLKLASRDGRIRLDTTSDLTWSTTLQHAAANNLNATPISITVRVPRSTTYCFSASVAAPSSYSDPISVAGLFVRANGALVSTGSRAQCKNGASLCGTTELAAGVTTLTFSTDYALVGYFIDFQSCATTPFSSNGGLAMEAENFDIGIASSYFAHCDSFSKGTSAYRSPNNMLYDRIGPPSRTDVCLCPGSFMNYSIQVANGGLYFIRFLVSSISNNVNLGVYVDGQSIFSISLDISSTMWLVATVHDNQTYITTPTKLSLSTGTHVLKVTVNSLMCIDKILVELAATDPEFQAIADLPSTIPIINFLNSDYYDTTIANEGNAKLRVPTVDTSKFDGVPCLVRFAQGEYVTYSIRVASAMTIVDTSLSYYMGRGSGPLSLRVKLLTSVGRFVLFDTFAVASPSTVTTPTLTQRRLPTTALPQGTHQLVLECVTASSSYNPNYDTPPLISIGFALSALYPSQANYASVPTELSLSQYCRIHNKSAALTPEGLLMDLLDDITFIFFSQSDFEVDIVTNTRRCKTTSSIVPLNVTLDGTSTDYMFSSSTAFVRLVVSPTTGPFHFLILQKSTLYSSSSYCKNLTVTAIHLQRGSGPFSGEPWPIPGEIMAAQFDYGNTFYDTTQDNSGGSPLRPFCGVDIARVGQVDHVVDIKAGEYMTYTIRVARQGWYNVFMDGEVSFVESVSAQYNVLTLLWKSGDVSTWAHSCTLNWVGNSGTLRRAFIGSISLPADTTYLKVQFPSLALKFRRLSKLSFVYEVRGRTPSDLYSFTYHQVPLGDVISQDQLATECWPRANLYASTTFTSSAAALYPVMVPFAGNYSLQYVNGTCAASNFRASWGGTSWSSFAIPSKESFTYPITATTPALLNRGVYALSVSYTASKSCTALSMRFAPAFSNDTNKCFMAYTPSGLSNLTLECGRTVEINTLSSTCTSGYISAFVDFADGRSEALLSYGMGKKTFRTVGDLPNSMLALKFRIPPSYCGASPAVLRTACTCNSQPASCSQFISTITKYKCEEPIDQNVQYSVITGAYTNSGAPLELYSAQTWTSCALHCTIQESCVAFSFLQKEVDSVCSFSTVEDNTVVIDATAPQAVYGVVLRDVNLYRYVAMSQDNIFTVMPQEAGWSSVLFVLRYGGRLSVPVSGLSKAYLAVDTNLLCDNSQWVALLGTGFARQCGPQYETCSSTGCRDLAVPTNTPLFCGVVQYSRVVASGSIAALIGPAPRTASCRGGSGIGAVHFLGQEAPVEGPQLYAVAQDQYSVAERIMLINNQSLRLQRVSGISQQTTRYVCIFPLMSGFTAIKDTQGDALKSYKCGSFLNVADAARACEKSGACKGFTTLRKINVETPGCLFQSAVTTSSASTFGGSSTFYRKRVPRSTACSITLPAAVSKLVVAVTQTSFGLRTGGEITISHNLSPVVQCGGTKRFLGSGGVSDKCDTALSCYNGPLRSSSQDVLTIEASVEVLQSGWAHSCEHAAVVMAEFTFTAELPSKGHVPTNANAITVRLPMSVVSSRSMKFSSISSVGLMIREHMDDAASQRRRTAPRFSVEHVGSSTTSFDCSETTEGSAVMTGCDRMFMCKASNASAMLEIPASNDVGVLTLKHSSSVDTSSCSQNEFAEGILFFVGSPTVSLDTNLVVRALWLASVNSDISGLAAACGVGLADIANPFGKTLRITRDYPTFAITSKQDYVPLDTAYVVESSKRWYDAPVKAMLCTIPTFFDVLAAVTCRVRLDRSNYVRVMVAQTYFSDSTMSVTVKVGDVSRECGMASSTQSFLFGMALTQDCETFLTCYEGPVRPGDEEVVVTFNSPRNVAQLTSCPDYVAAAVVEPSVVDYNLTCSGNRFPCYADGSCLDLSNVCDGVAHCSDLSDEARCTYALFSTSIYPQCVGNISFEQAASASFDTCRSYSLAYSPLDAPSILFVKDQLCVALMCVDYEDISLQMRNATVAGVEFYIPSDKSSYVSYCTSELHCLSRGRVISATPPCTCECFEGYIGESCRDIRTISTMSSVLLSFDVDSLFDENKVAEFLRQLSRVLGRASVALEMSQQQRTSSGVVVEIKVTPRDSTITQTSAIAQLLEPAAQEALANSLFELGFVLQEMSSSAPFVFSGSVSCLRVGVPKSSVVTSKNTSKILRNTNVKVYGAVEDSTQIWVTNSSVCEDTSSHVSSYCQQTLDCEYKFIAERVGSVWCPVVALNETIDCDDVLVNYTYSPFLPVPLQTPQEANRPLPTMWVALFVVALLLGICTAALFCVCSKQRDDDSEASSRGATKYFLILFATACLFASIIFATLGWYSWREDVVVVAVLHVDEYRSSRCSNTTINPIPMRTSRVNADGVCHQLEVYGDVESPAFVAAFCHPNRTEVAFGHSMKECRDATLKTYPSGVCLSEQLLLPRKRDGEKQYVELVCFSVAESTSRWSFIAKTFPVPQSDGVSVVPSKSNPARASTRSETAFYVGDAFRKLPVVSLLEARSLVATTNSFVPLLGRSDAVVYRDSAGVESAPSYTGEGGAEMSNRGTLFNGFTQNGSVSRGDEDAFGAFRYVGIGGTELDVGAFASGEFTVTFWLRASQQTSGFVYILTDAWMRRDTFASPVVKLLLEMIQNGHSYDSYYNTTWHVYTALYVDGASKTFRLISTAPREEDGGHREVEWDAALMGKEGIGRVFDGNWHFLSIQVLSQVSRRAARIAVDGTMLFATAGWTLCLPKGSAVRPVEWLPDLTTIKSPTEESVAQGGVLYAGHLNAGLYNLQFHKTVLDLERIRYLGAPGMETSQRYLSYLIILGLVLASLFGVYFLQNFVLIIRDILRERRQESAAPFIPFTRTNELEKEEEEEDGNKSNVATKAQQLHSATSGNNAWGNLRVIIPCLLNVLQALSLFMVAWRWPPEIERTLRPIVQVFAILFNIPNVPDLVIPGILLGVGTALTLFMFVFGNSDSKRFAVEIIGVIVNRITNAKQPKKDRNGSDSVKYDASLVTNTGARKAIVDASEVLRACETLYPSGKCDATLSVRELVTVTKHEGNQIQRKQEKQLVEWKVVVDAVAKDGKYVVHVHREIPTEQLGPDQQQPGQPFNVQQRQENPLQSQHMQSPRFVSYTLAVEVHNSTRCPVHDRVLVAAAPGVHNLGARRQCAFYTNRWLPGMSGKRACGGIRDQLSCYVCPEEDCEYTICHEKHLCVSDGFTNFQCFAASVAGKWIEIVHAGVLSVVGQLLILFAQLLFLPVIQCATMIIFCHPQYHCILGGCYEDPTRLFIVGAAFAVIVSLCFGLGVVIFFVYTAMRRKMVLIDQGFFSGRFVDSTGSRTIADPHNDMGENHCRPSKRRLGRSTLIRYHCLQRALRKLQVPACLPSAHRNDLQTRSRFTDGPP